MLLPIARFIDTPVMSLQTGTELARTTEPIIDPRNLTIIAFYVDGNHLENNPSILHVSDIREVSDIGMIVDDSERIMSPDGLVRLEEILAFEFRLDNLNVIDEAGHKLGKVTDYALEAATFSVQQLYTKQSLIRSITMTSNLIHRSQIISVTNQRIVVKSGHVRDSISEKVGDTTQFVNPFRAGQTRQVPGE